MQISMRLALGFLGALLPSACSNGSSSPSTAPTPTATSTPTSYTVSGVVSDGAQPIEGAYISAWIVQGPFGSAYALWAHGSLLTDAAGHYSLTGLPAQAIVWLNTLKVGYVQQCAAAVTLSG